jgi:hypothetical protein
MYLILEATSRDKEMDEIRSENLCMASIENLKLGGPTTNPKATSCIHHPSSIIHWKPVIE